MSTPPNFQTEKIKEEPLQRRVESSSTAPSLPPFPDLSQPGRVLTNVKRGSVLPDLTTSAFPASVQRKLSERKWEDKDYASLMDAVVEKDFPKVQNILSELHFSKASPDQQELLLDAAFSSEHEDIVYLFLGVTERLPKANTVSKDTESYFSQRLLQAHKLKLVEEQIITLVRLGNLYQQRDLPKGAKLLNCAMALLQRNKKLPHLEGYLFSRLERVELLFLKNEGVKKFDLLLDKGKSIKQHRAQIRLIREECKAGFKKDIKEAQNQLTIRFKNLLRTLIYEAQQLLGPSPVAWACLGMGSMARNEMCPYSDVEFAFLVENDSQEALTYFRALAKFLEIKMINLGETKFEVFGAGTSPTPDGFCMDSGGNVPLGGIFELIGTPSQLALLQTKSWIDDSIILANVMTCVCLVQGDEKLLIQYNKEKMAVQKLKERDVSLFDDKKVFAEMSNQKRLAMRLLAGHLEEFSPNLSFEKEKLGAFGIKKELYRPFQEIISSLALLYELDSRNTLDRIEELVKKKVFSIKGGENLKTALKSILKLRVTAHLYYEDECEFLHHMEEKREEKKLYLDQELLQALSEIYRVLIPFCKSFKAFYKNQDKKVLQTQGFYDESPRVRAIALQRALQYEEAEKAYQEAVSLNPNDVDALILLGNMQGTKANYGQSLERSKKALQIAQSKGEDSSDVAFSNNSVAMNLLHLGRHQEALDLFAKALGIFINLYGVDHEYTACTFYNIGCIYSITEDYDRSSRSFMKTLDILFPRFGNNHPMIDYCYNAIGGSLIRQGQFEGGLAFFKMALKLRITTKGKNHPTVAATLSNIGNALTKLKQPVEALKYLQQSLEIQQNVYGLNHSDIAAGLYEMGYTYRVLKQFSEALKAHERALEMRIAIYGETHETVSMSYSNIANVYRDMDRLPDSVDYLKKALKVQLDLWGENNHEVALSYNNLGVAYIAVKNIPEGLTHLRKGLQIRLSLFGENHSDVAYSQYSLGSILLSEDKAEALNLFKAAYKTLHPLRGPFDSLVLDIKSKIKEQGEDPPEESLDETAAFMGFLTQLMDKSKK